MQTNYKTARLLLNELTINEHEFIRELVNTPGWIQFIGDRNIKNKEDATAYIQKIIDNPNINYWVVKTKDQQLPIGVITFIQRNYLDHPDIGFAFLPRHTKQGFAYEATKAVLDEVIKDKVHSQILATTLKENVNSIQLLEKLGLRFHKEIEVEDELLLVYGMNISNE